MTASKPISDDDIAYIKTQVKMVWVDGQPRFEWIIRKPGIKFGGLAGITHLRHGGRPYRRLRFTLPSGCTVQPAEQNLVWRFHHGEWPLLEVDHRDGDGTNNDPENLRLATPAQNVANRGRKKTATNPALGVRVQLNAPNVPFSAEVCSTQEGKRTCHRGSFATLEEAVKWRTAKAKEIHGEFARI